MRVEKTENGREYIYEENFWTGKTTLTIDGKTAIKSSRKKFVDPSDDQTIHVRGTFLTGVSLLKNQEAVVLVKNKWYETLLIFLPIITIIFGVLNGAVGGALSAVFACVGFVVNAFILRSSFNKVIAVILTLLITAACVFIYLLCITAILSALGFVSTQSLLA